MYRQFIIKSLQEEKMSLGDKSAWINTILIEAEVKRSFIEKFTKKAEIFLFSVINNSEAHNRVKKAYMSNSSWEIDMDDFSKWSIKNRFVYLNKEIIEEKNKYIKKKQEEREAAKAAEEKRKKAVEATTNEIKAKSEENQENGLHRYFTAIKDLIVFNFKNSDVSLRPYDMSFIQNDIHILNIMLSFDPEIKKYFPQFWGAQAEENLQNYLVNTCMTTEAGIAFAYAIRVNAGIIGLIKVTSPEHNKVTNNFPYWMIDYFMIPAMRNRKLMKASLRVILNFMHENLKIDEVYAMVDTENAASIHLLELNGFNEDKSKHIAANPATGNVPIAMRKTF